MSKLIEKAKLVDKSNLTPEEQIREIVRCRQDFSYFCSNYIVIFNPTLGLCNFNLYEYQEQTFKEYTENRFVIIRKFRQGGLSTMTAIYILWRMVFFVDQSTAVFSISDREAMEFHKLIRRAYDNLPAWLRGEPLVANNHELVLETGGSVFCATPKAGRGFSKGLLVVDEAAFIPDMDDFWARVYPTISTGGSVIAISTVNGIGNWYHKTWIDAENNLNDFHPIRLSYQEHPQYKDPEWVEQTKKNLGDKKWRQEVEGEFLGSANTFIPIDTLKSMEEKTNFPVKRKLDDALHIWKEPIKGHLYIVGGDPSQGLGSDSGTDFSCAQVIDAATLEQVAEFYSQDYPTKKFAAVLQALGKHYNTACVVVENNKMGLPVLNSLYDDLHYENIYFSTLANGLKKKPRRGFNSNVKTRYQTQDLLYHVFIHDLAKVNSRRLVSELFTWILDPTTMKAEHLKGYHDDATMALGMALMVREERFHRQGVMSYLSDDNMQFVNTYIEDGSILHELSDSGEESSEQPAILGFSVRSQTDDDEDFMKEFGW